MKETEINPAPGETEQTVFVYMPWSSNLTSYFQINISDFEKALLKNPPTSERVVVFFATSPSDATLFELKVEKGVNLRNTLKSYTDPAFTTAAGITSILNDVQSFAPAKRYGMEVSSHGMGWIPVSQSASAAMRSAGIKFHWEHENVPLTRYFGGLTSQYQTDITSLAEGISDAGLKMEYILFDDCYMSAIEVAYDLKDITDHLIASPTEVMAYGMPYAEIGRYLVGNVDYYGITNGFYEFYKDYSTPCGTIAVTRTSELEALAAVMKEINQRFSFDQLQLNDIQRMDGYSPVIFFDYGDYVAKLCTDQGLLERFNAQLERAVPSLYSMHTPTYYSMSRGRVDIDAFSGTTVSDPSIHSLAAKKEQTAWYKATH